MKCVGPIIPSYGYQTPKHQGGTPLPPHPEQFLEQVWRRGLSREIRACLGGAVASSSPWAYASIDNSTAIMVRDDETYPEDGGAKAFPSMLRPMLARLPTFHLDSVL